MAIRVDERRMVEDNVRLRYTREKFRGVRYQETTPTFVEYFHIDPQESTTDPGFEDVAAYIGTRSPIKYNKIIDFPLYGLEQIVLQLQEEDQGLDSSYDGQAIILPNTIKPLQNDYFIIPTLKGPYLFRVTSIEYDTTMPDSYYRISFVLDYEDPEKIDEINAQVPKHKEYVSRLENIGTETTAIIEKGHFYEIKALEEMLDRIKSGYMAMFYSDRYDAFLGPLDKAHMQTIYDPFQVAFINKHQIFNTPRDFKTLHLTEHVTYPDMRLKYAKSVYSFIEHPSLDHISRFPYVYQTGVTFHDSGFYHWRDPHVQVADIIEHWPIEPMYTFSEEFVNDVIVNNDTRTEYGNFLKRYIRGEKLCLEDIPEKMDEELIYLNDSMEVFVMIPILVYIIKKIIEKEEHIEQKIQ